ncbi:MAG: DnaJ domain-containing protein [Oleiphilaceae bacterium]|nr:DnaJ domain-containing protein [Oleiphilaceae bacterium]
MIRFILIAAFLLGLVALLRHFNSLDQAGRKRFWKRFAFGLVLTLVLFLTATGRLHYIAAVVTAVFPFIKKLLPVLRYIPFFKNLYQQSQAAQSAGSGQQSSVTTSLLSMELDHDSASLDGEILKGRFKGKRLSELSQPELLALYAEAQRDYQDSIELLEAYLQRELGDEWRDYQAREQHDAASEVPSQLSIADAYEVLGLEDGATREEVVQAHRKLMQKFHPDRGGNDYLAAQINQAKDILLKALQ